jgi:hypothetical protein
LTSNWEKRNEIELCRNEKKLFEEILDKIVNEYESIKNEISKLIDNCNKFYISRDSSISNMDLLKSQADKEHNEFEREWKELNRLIENDSKMKEFLKSGGETPIPNPPLLPPATTAGMGVEDRVSGNENRERIKIISNFFKNIQNSTGFSNLHEIVEFFNFNEISNNSLFSQLTSNSEEIAELNKLIESVSTNTNLIRQGNGEDVYVSELEDKLSKIEKENEKIIREISNIYKIINLIRNFISNSIFKYSNKIQKFSNFLNLNDFNLSEFLSYIENIVTRDLHLYRRINPVGRMPRKSLAADNRPPNPRNSLFGVNTNGQKDNSALAPIGKMMQNFKIPSSMDDNDHDGDDGEDNETERGGQDGSSPNNTNEEVKPLSQDELRNRVMLKLKKKMLKFEKKRK